MLAKRLFLNRNGIASFMRTTQKPFSNKLDDKKEPEKFELPPGKETFYDKMFNQYQKSYFSMSNYWQSNLFPRFSGFFGLKKDEPKSYMDQMKDGISNFDTASFT